MAVKKVAKGWQVDIRPSGRGTRRIRKIFPTKAEANRFVAWVKHQHDQGREWNPRARDNRHLSELVEQWHRLHGVQLRDGEGRRRKLLHIAERLGDPVARKLTAADFSRYRSWRLEEGASPNTVNHEHAYLRSVYNELARLGEWDEGNPLNRIRQIKLLERELTFLTTGQIRDLFHALQASRNPDAERVTKLCLATGARWSEAETLTAERLFASRVVYAETKSGRIRSVPIAPELADELRTRESGRLFRSCYAAFRKAVERTGIHLPRGQMAHVLRHTFASHFMMNGGNLLTLQRILGHANIQMTMRYAHLAPDHLEEAVKLNPVAVIGIE